MRSYFLHFVILLSLILILNVNGEKKRYTNTNGLTIEYYGIDSRESIQRTQMLRDNQYGIALEDNGEDIIFVDSEGIYVQFADGSGRRLLISKGSGYNSFCYPAWSLDGNKIAFAANRTDPRIADLWVANSDGSDLTLIFTFDQGYYSSYITSISWKSTNDYIMFSVWYDDWQSNSYFVLASILYTGENLSLGNGFDHTYCQYDPTNWINRYAYVSSGIPGYFNSELRVTTLTGYQVWLQHTGVISGLTHVCWNNPNSIYTIVRFWDQYPDKEVMVRVDKNGGNYTFTPLLFSGLNSSLWSPTVSPDRTQMYIAELTSSSLLMYLVTFDQNGNVVDIQQKGTGSYPNWRQSFPLPGQVTLISPPDGASGVSINPELSWQSVPTAINYKLEVFNYAGTLVYSIDDIPYTQITIGPLEYSTQYVWIVSAKNFLGYGPPSSPFSFTTKSGSGVSDENSEFEFALNQNYPNPFNSITMITYQIPEMSFLTLKVYDVLGNEVATLVNEEKPTGFYEVEFNSEGFTSGVYFFKLRAGKFVEIKKMVLIK